MSDFGIYALTKALAGGVFAVATGPVGNVDLPSQDIAATLSSPNYAVISEVASSEGNDLGRLDLSATRSLPLESVPDHFIKAVMAIEDIRFGEHPGVDPFAVASALKDGLSGNIRGGSTLTQQLAKNITVRNDQTLNRKIAEATIALRIQDALTPGVVFETYLSKAYLGRGGPGGAGAAMGWFGKPWMDLELHEAALLAGMLKGASYYDPVRHPERATQRRNLVLNAMLQNDIISPQAHEAAIAAPLGVLHEDGSLQSDNWVTGALASSLTRLDYAPIPRRSADSTLIQSTISSQWQDIAQKALSDGLVRLSGIGPAGNIALPDINEDTLSVTLVRKIRTAAAHHLSSTQKSGRFIVTSRNGKTLKGLIDPGFGSLTPAEAVAPAGFTARKGDILAYTREAGEIKLSGVPKLNGAVVVMSPSDGRILASVGGFNPDQSAFDRTQALRQPGSSIKPFLWLTALEAGTPFDAMVDDIARDYHTGAGQIWRPRNYDRSSTGLIPLFVGLEESSNQVAASLIDTYGPEAMAYIAEQVGAYPARGMNRHPTSALGASETTLTRMVAGYSAIANGGYAITPHAIESVLDGSEQVWSDQQISTPAVLSPEAASYLQRMLYGVTRRGTAANIFKSPLRVAGKTGTTQNYKDAWFIGFTPDAVIGVWVGRDDNRSSARNLTGGGSAAPIVSDIFNGAIASGLLTSTGMSPTRSETVPWPPVLLEARRGNQNLAQSRQAAPPSGEEIMQMIRSGEGGETVVVPAPPKQDYLSNPNPNSNGDLLGNDPLFTDSW